MTFNKEEGKHEIEVKKLTASFSLKMASIICWTVALIVISLGIFFGSNSLTGLFFIGIFALILTIITFIVSYSRAGSML